MKTFVRFLIVVFPWLSATYRRRIKRRQKCPACGNVNDQKIVFSPDNGLVVLTCTVCSAVWAFDTIVPTPHWMKKPE